MNLYKNNLLDQIFRFLVVGGTAFLIDFLVLYILIEQVGLSYLLANSISFTISVIYNYILSTLWVFDTKHTKSKCWELVVFTLLSLIGLGINQGIMWIAVEQAEINYLLSKILATIIVMNFNFITRKHILEKPMRKGKH